MNWLISVANPARKQLQKIDFGDAEKIEIAIDKMADNPFAGDVQKMSGKEDVWRRRVGSYRIFFRPDSNLHIIYILEIIRRTSKTY